MTQVAINDKLAQEAVYLYPNQTLDKITDKALERYLACAELLQMKGILKDDDIWEDAYTEDNSVGDLK
jgi:hypothetical protein